MEIHYAGTLSGSVSFIQVQKLADLAQKLGTKKLGANLLRKQEKMKEEIEGRAAREVDEIYNSE